MGCVSQNHRKPIGKHRWSLRSTCAALDRQCGYILCSFTRHLKNKLPLQVLWKPTLRGRHLFQTMRYSSMWGIAL